MAVRRLSQDPTLTPTPFHQMPRFDFLHGCASPAQPRRSYNLQPNFDGAVISELVRNWRLLSRKDLPRHTKKSVDAYSEAEVAALLSAPYPIAHEVARTGLMDSGERLRGIVQVGRMKSYPSDTALGAACFCKRFRSERRSWW